MLSRWRKEHREGRLRARVSGVPGVRERREMEQLSALKREHELLEEEHELLKKAIRFCSARRQPSSPSSKRSKNAFVESFFHSMKADVIHRRSFDDHRALHATISRYIRRYNRTRLHSSLGHLSPINYEHAAA